MNIPFINFIEERLKPGFLLITCGLPGTWKTETSQEISKTKRYPILRTDLIRLEVLKDENIFDEKVSSNLSKRELVYMEMFHQADELAQKNSGVILDATFVTRKLRKRASDVAARHKKTFVILQTSCTQEASIGRILKRTKEKYESNALTEEAYQHNKKKFEPINLNHLKNLYPDINIIHFTVDTEYDPPEKWYVIDLEQK
ncbi:MAG: ATP-binding protein [Candidatus Heimdallarchaeota archaeon]|nr:ATP-binding protein [Candidatus Heimdallarchaeota archaeon]